MSATTDLDAILRGWLSEGAERAPAQPVRAALDATSSMPQRWPMRAPRQFAGPAWARSLIVAAAGALLLAIGIGIGIQSGLIRIPQPSPPTPNVASPSLAPTPTPTVHPAEGRPFIAPDGTFQIQLPADWHRVNGPDPATLYLATERFELSIRGGDADGSVRMCDEGAGPWEVCLTANATTLDELADAVKLQPRQDALVGTQGPLYRSMTLAGEPARVKVMVAAETTASGQESVKYIVAMHGGRPFVLRLWASDNGALDSVVPLLEHFSFLDPERRDSPDATAEPGAADLQTFRAQDGSFVIRLPAGWEERAGPDPSALYLRNGNVSVSIRAGDEVGRIRTCDTLGAVPFEVCPMVTATTLDDLANAIAVSEGQYPHLGPNEAAATLGGEPATSITVISGVSPPIGVIYVVAVHDGRPFIVRARQDRPPDPLFDVLRALDGFEFR